MARNIDAERARDGLLVTLAQAVLMLINPGFVPKRLIEQLARGVADLEAATMDYARPRIVVANDRDPPAPVA